MQVSVDVHVVLVVHITHVRTWCWQHTILQTVLQLLWYSTSAVQDMVSRCAPHSLHPGGHILTP